MAPRADRNLRMARSREGARPLPKLPGTPERVDRQGLRVGHPAASGLAADVNGSSVAQKDEAGKKDRCGSMPI
jgi:hypothetical protein